MLYSFEINTTLIHFQKETKPGFYMYVFDELDQMRDKMHC